MHPRAEIINLLNGNVVRRLTAQGDTVEIDAFTEKAVVPLDAPITFEPWRFDRGNLLFACDLYPQAKLCTEADYVRYEDGQERIIYPEARRP